VLRDPSARWGRVFQRIALICGGAAVVAGAAFVGVGLIVYGRQNAQGLLQWVSSYSGNALPMWGAWTPGPVLTAVGSGFKSVLGMELWMFRFFLVHLKNGELPRWVAPLGFVVLAAALIVLFRGGLPKRKDEGRTALWLLCMYCAYAPFIIWWEPI